MDYLAADKSYFLSIIPSPQVFAVITSLRKVHRTTLKRVCSLLSSWIIWKSTQDSKWPAKHSKINFAINFVWLILRCPTKLSLDIGAKQNPQNSGGGLTGFAHPNLVVYPRFHLENWMGGRWFGVKRPIPSNVSVFSSNNQFPQDSKFPRLGSNAKDSL